MKVSALTFMLVPLPASSGGYLISPKFTVPTEHPPLPTADALKTHTSGRSADDNCARVTDLGFTMHKHIKMYGEQFELISDPFVDGDYTTVHAISRNDPRVRELRLPVSILVGLPDPFRRQAKATPQKTQ
jgi:hypothetical protein